MCVKERQGKGSAQPGKGGTALLVLLFGCLFAAFLFCFAGEDEGTLRVGIFYGSNWDVPGTAHYEILEAAIEKFKEKYPNVEVEYEKGIQPDDYSEWLSEQILKGTEPDVYLVLDEDFETLAGLGALKNLNKLQLADMDYDASVFYESLYKAGQYETGQYALPFECNPTLMFVNKTLLEAEGIAVPDNDWTWDDFYEICEKVVRDSDGDGQIDQFGCYGYSWRQAVYSNGALPFKNGGTAANFMNAKVDAALEFVKKLEATNRNYSVTSNDFDLGKVAFRPLTFSDYRTYMPYPWRIKKYSDFAWTCIRMPAGPSGDHRSELSVLMTGISARTKRERQAWDFVKLLTTDEAMQRLIYEDSSGASVLRSVTESAETMALLNEDTPGESQVDMSILSGVIEEGIVPEHFANDEAAYERADSAIGSYLSGEDDSSTFFFQLQNELDEVLK